VVIEPSGMQATVTGAIRQAARLTGTNFQYLLATAQVESKLNPNAQVATSSARGLFQFIEQTWLATLKEEGPSLGYAPYADAIGRSASGEYMVVDPRHQSAVMNLRFDPTANAVMAGAFTRTNAAKLASAIGRKPSEGELYLAHFLGANGATKLIGLATSSPRTRAAAEFPTAARSNPSIFFDRQGRARGAGEVYGMLVGRYDVARGVKSNPAVPAAVVATAAVKAPQRTSFAPDSVQLADTYAAAARISTASAQAPDTKPVFHGLFRTGERRDAVAPLVSALWAAPKPQPLPAEPPLAAVEAPVGQDRPAPDAAVGGPLDLFQDQLPDARALFRGRV
jgi:hypothetical protein